MHFQIRNTIVTCAAKCTIWRCVLLFTWWDAASTLRVNNESSIILNVTLFVSTAAWWQALCSHPFWIHWGWSSSPLTHQRKATRCYFTLVVWECGTSRTYSAQPPHLRAVVSINYSFDLPQKKCLCY